MDRSPTPWAPNHDPEDRRHLFVILTGMAAGLFVLLVLVGLQTSARPKAHRLPPYRINLNTADAPTCQLLPGIGPVLAQRIVTERRRGGDYAGWTDLANRIAGLADKTVTQLQPWACFDSGEPDTPAP